MTEIKKTCPCGRSPTGVCMGWHALTEDEYKLKLQEYKDSQSMPKDSEQGG